MLKNYAQLPDYMDADDLVSYFNDLLNSIDTANEVDYEFVIHGLSELADRQWHTYTLLEQGTKLRTEKLINGLLINKQWKDKSVFFFRRILSIIGNLGLSSSYAIVKQLSGEETQAVIQQEIEQFIHDVDKRSGGKVDDPYITLK